MQSIGREYLLARNKTDEFLKHIPRTVSFASLAIFALVGNAFFMILLIFAIEESVLLLAIVFKGVADKAYVSRSSYGDCRRAIRSSFSILTIFDETFSLILVLNTIF